MSLKISDTPITDEVEHSYTYPGKGDIGRVFKAMRQLEREIADLKKQVEEGDGKATTALNNLSFAKSVMLDLHNGKLGSHDEQGFRVAEALECFKTVEKFLKEGK